MFDQNFLFMPLLGIIAPVFQERFDASKAETSLIGSILIGFYLMMGPIVSALTNKFGCRFVTMLGALIAALAFFLGRYQDSINGLIGCYGVLGMTRVSCTSF